MEVTGSLSEQGTGEPSPNLSVHLLLQSERLEPWLEAVFHSSCVRLWRPLTDA